MAQNTSCFKVATWAEFFQKYNLPLTQYIPMASLQRRSPVTPCRDPGVNYAPGARNNQPDKAGDS